MRLLCYRGNSGNRVQGRIWGRIRGWEDNGRGYLYPEPARPRGPRSIRRPSSLSRKRARSFIWMRSPARCGAFSPNRVITLKSSRPLLTPFPIPAGTGSPPISRSALLEWTCGAFLEEKFDYGKCIVPGHTITADIDVGPNPYRDRYRRLLRRHVELSRAGRRVPRGPSDLINSLGRALTKSGNTGRAITLARDILPLPARCPRLGRPGC